MKESTSRISHIALIGCGFTGTSAFFQLVERFPVKKITIFEASGDFGPGYAYKTEECPDYLINNTTDTMCLAPSNRSAFFNWLKTQADFGADTDPKGHLPRAIYGRFFKDIFSTTRTQAAIKGIKL
ncbi:MAG: FAD/NAD(P)-binding protein [Pseudomonadota bacterium]